MLIAGIALGLFALVLVFFTISDFFTRRRNRRYWNCAKSQHRFGTSHRTCQCMSPWGAEMDGVERCMTCLLPVK